MRFPNSLKILSLSILGVLLVPAFLPTTATINPKPVMASYNPPPANNFHAPLSSMALAALTNATPNIQSLTSSNSQSNVASSLKTIRQNALRFIMDDSYFPQSETSIAVDPNNPNHIVGGFNDLKYFYCLFLPSDCGGSFSVSISGFTTSIDGGATVAKSGDIPNINTTDPILTSWGDPSVAASIDGNFYYASLAISPGGGFFGGGIMIAKSNANLFNPNVSCATSASTPLSNPCWKDVFVNGTNRFPDFTFEDKDRIAVDRDLTSPYYGSVYVGWDHFYPPGLSQTYLSRCDPNLVHCTMVSGGDQPVVSGSDPFVGWTTPVVDKNGNVYLTWCNFGTFTTFGPVSCRISSSPPGGAGFSAPVDILSYMGSGTSLPTDTVIIGWATEQFRTSPGIISLAADLSSKSNNLYFTTSVCASGHYYKFSWLNAFVAMDNPGDCGQSAVLSSRSTDGGQSWSSPTTLSHPAVNDQSYVTVDSQTGTVYVVYYTTQYDTFNHRIDVVASTSNTLGKTFSQQRVTTVSNEPDSDPNMYDYIVRGGFGGSFTVPQYGDYFEATALGGTLWVLFTGNYAVEAGTFQTDPFLAVSHQSS